MVGKYKKRIAIYSFIFAFLLVVQTSIYLNRNINHCSKTSTVDDVKLWQNYFNQNKVFELCMSDIGYPVFKHPLLAFEWMKIENSIGLLRMMMDIQFPILSIRFEEYSQYYFAGDYPTSFAFVSKEIDKIKLVLEFYENSFETIKPFN